MVVAVLFIEGVGISGSILGEYCREAWLDDIDCHEIKAKNKRAIPANAVRVVKKPPKLILKNTFP